ncbi:MAG: glutamyl-tRNA reductase [Gemmataceae bacterium]|nr:glutamyl-tRNA reductase [Gemmataceae bacterium]
MKLHLTGCNFRTAPVDLREKLVIAEGRLPAALADLQARHGGEATILSTCNRLEIYQADCSGPPDLAGWLADWQSVAPAALAPALYSRSDADAVRHLFRVAASLDSLVVGEGQIAGQVKTAYEQARENAAAGPLLHALFQQARVVAKRVRRETGISRGHVSVSSVAVDYVRQVFDHFADKVVLVIGAGKMGRLTLDHLKELGVAWIFVTNRNPDRAREVAGGCGGTAVPWDQLDEVLARADIVLSTTGAPEPIMSAERFAPIAARRTTSPMVILDIAVPRDFDPAIHDGDQVCLFNIDDLQRLRTATMAERLRHVGPAEAIVEQEARKFVGEWARRRTGPVIAKLTADCDARRQLIWNQLQSRLNGKLSDDDRRQIEGALRLLQNQILHGPISALAEETRSGSGTGLIDALRQLFRLKD